MATLRKSCSPSFRTFGLAVQAMVVLAASEQACPSCNIAAKLESEATLLRKILAVMAKQQLIETREGRDGGYRLLRPASEITLADIYRALQISGEMCRTMEEATSSHPFGLRMKEAFGSLLSELDDSMIAVLEKHNLAEYVQKSGCQ